MAAQGPNRLHLHEGVSLWTSCRTLPTLPAVDALHGLVHHALLPVALHGVLLGARGSHHDRILGGWSRVLASLGNVCLQRDRSHLVLHGVQKILLKVFFNDGRTRRWQSTTIHEVSALQLL